MNTKKWLTLGLSVALAGCLGWAVAACAPTEPNTPDEGDNPSTPHVHTYTKWDHSETEHWRVCPDDQEIDVSSRAKHSFDKVTHVCLLCGYEEPHTHTYTQWAHDAVYHWKFCPGDFAVDESTRELHNFVEGKCEDCGMAEPEMYVYGVGKEVFGNVGHWPTSLDIRQKKDKWVKMELGDDGKYTADVYLTPDALFAVGDATSLVRYPAAEDPDATTGALQVEAANTYTVTFDPADGTVTFAVHAHTYVWKYDADNHWKVCSTKDQAVDESSKGAHSYDPDTHACVCGAVGTASCDHSKGYVFDYTELPECNAEGGTLQKTCPDCGDTQDVSYSKGFTGTGRSTAAGTIGDISEEGTYYFTTGAKFQTLGMKITEAGTYTLTFEEVCDLNSYDGRLILTALAFADSYLSSLGGSSGACISSRSIKNQEQITSYDVKINGVTPENAVERVSLVTFSFTVTEEQLQAGDLYVTIHLGGYKEDTTSNAGADKLSHLVTVKKD